MPAVARRPSAENTTWVTRSNSALLSRRGSSASSTTGMPRARAAAQMSRTKPGKRLSAITASTPATSAAGCSGRAAARRSSRKFAIARSPRASMQIAETDVGTSRRRGQAEQSMPWRAASVRNVSPTRVDAGRPPSGPEKRARAPRCAIATAAFAALPPLTVQNSLAWVFTSGRGNAFHPEQHVDDRDAGAQHMPGVSRRHRRPLRPRRG